MLAREGFIIANDADVHPAMAGSLSDYFKDAEVRSVLASSISLNGHLFGALTCMQVQEPQEWKPRQLTAMRQIAAPIGLALHRSSRLTADTGFGFFV
jgi:GAF domain-containing protein